MSQESSLKDSEKRLRELSEIITQTQKAEVQALFDVAYQAANQSYALLARALHSQLCAARAYIGELHRKIDDQSGGLS